MDIKKFETNVSCSGCVAKLAPSLTEKYGSEAWSFDLTSADKELQITAEEVKTEDVARIFSENGYQAKEKEDLLKKFFG